MSRDPPVQFSDQQGQLLAYIHEYIRVNARSPSEQELQLYFLGSFNRRSILNMLNMFERSQLIRRRSDVRRSIELLVDPKWLPPLRAARPIKHDG